ncbi:ABC transporter ATPase [Croceimicrobium hydrocarbonivorans]|uniref:ABC transporter ATPase n=1 Tax=Croceimicrobium hydrocarbonivorans TaxID=2761580 RepID=A0A7H0VDR5_9FLAO|nr:ABC transporter ATPase [Croceimicrobium hydrocarbonivorans]QNR23863.1 ABC transporter ATPase [Croceimicrobium hydrocarbonivorans]
MYSAFDEMNEDARIWIYQSTEFLEFEKVERITARLMNFLDDWKAHGHPLNASFTIIYDRFIVVSLDEASYQATGCSIDKLVQHMQNLERELNISLLDRTQIAFRDHNSMIETMHMMDFRAALENGDLDQNTVVFNNLVATKGEMEKKWETIISNSWHKDWLPIA